MVRIDWRLMKPSNQAMSALPSPNELYNLPVESLRRRVIGSVKLNCRPGPSTELTEEEEERLAAYQIQMSEMGYRIT